jgi:hypothetical protein
VILLFASLFFLFFFVSLFFLFFFVSLLIDKRSLSTDVAKLRSAFFLSFAQKTEKQSRKREAKSKNKKQAGCSFTTPVDKLRLSNEVNYFSLLLFFLSKAQKKGRSQRHSRKRRSRKK